MKIPTLFTFRLVLCLLLSSGLLSCVHNEPAVSADGLHKQPGEVAPDQMEAALLSSVHQLTFAGARSGEGYFSADGKMLVFQSERDKNNPFYQIYLMDLITGATKRVSQGIGKATCSWIHPKGHSVLYSATHLDPKARRSQKEELAFRASGQKRRYAWDYDPSYEIFAKDLSRGGMSQLTKMRGYDAEASWSPDGSKIVFVSNRLAYSSKLSEEDKPRLKDDPSYFIEIYLMNSDGTGITRLTDSPGYDGGPFFSADGKKITWRRFSPDGATAEIYQMKIDGSQQEKVTQLGAMSWAPFFHPSGDYLIFTTNLQGFENFELYLVRSDGKGKPVRVTYTPGFDGLPVFAPDGNTLSWTSTRSQSKTSQIFLAQWNDTEARKLLGLPTSAGSTATAVPEGSPSVAASTSDESRTGEIRITDLKKHIETLASDEMLGRLTGTLGEKKATDYAAELLESYGLKHLGDTKSFIQHFDFTAGVSLGTPNHLKVIAQEPGKSTSYKVGEEWLPLAFSSAGHIPAGEIVFAGYGIVAPALTTPEGDTFDTYDSYVHLDVKNKWVLLLRHVPNNVPAAFRKHLTRHASLRYKAMMARQLGARGIIIASGPAADVNHQLVPLAYDSAHSQTSIAAISVTNAIAQDLFAAADSDNSDKSLETLQKELDGGTPSIGFLLKGITIDAHITLSNEQRRGQNVIAVLPAASSAKKLGPIVVGAHIDHLGRGKNSSSLATPDEQGQIHYGADDNASGVAAALEIAEHIAALKKAGKITPARDLIIALWSGEELGLLGSAYFMQNYGKNKKAGTVVPIAAYLNMDMVGRLDRSLIIQGLGSSPEWDGEIEKAAASLHMAIIPQEDTYLPTDATSFYLQGVPILSAFTGAHHDYHTPRDTADKINYPGLLTITTLIDSITRSLLTSEKNLEYRKQDKPVEFGQRAYLRAYLGTIPDYATSETKGVRLAGVSAKGPAQAAGVLGGDIVIRLGGKSVENIYEYTYAIEALKPNETVEITVIRNGSEQTMQVTPKSRE